MSKYNESRHLPDNNGVPTGSGLYVWLNEQVTHRYGTELVAESQSHGNKRYQWLLQQLEARGDGETVQEYHRRHKAIEHERRQVERRAMLKDYQEQIETEPNEQRRMWLQKQIVKVQQSIQDAAQKG